MIKKITYIAEDGEEFDTAEECEAYEARFNNLNILADKAHFVAYDKFGDPFEIEDDDTLDDYESMIESLYYCYCDEISASTIKRLGDYFGLLVPSGPGYWRYDDTGRTDCFIDVKEDLEKFEEKWGPFGFHFLIKN